MDGARSPGPRSKCRWDCWSNQRQLPRPLRVMEPDMAMEGQAPEQLAGRRPLEH